MSGAINTRSNSNLNPISNPKLFLSGYYFMVHGKISDCAELKNRINEVGGLCVDMATFKLLYQNNDTQSNLFFVVDRGNYPSLSDNIKTTYKARIVPKVWMYLVLRKKQYQAHEKFIIENESTIMNLRSNHALQPQQQQAQYQDQLFRPSDNDRHHTNTTSAAANINTAANKKNKYSSSISGRKRVLDFTSSDSTPSKASLLPSAPVLPNLNRLEVQCKRSVQNIKQQKRNIAAHQQQQHTSHHDQHHKSNNNDNNHHHDKQGTISNNQLSSSPSTTTTSALVLDRAQGQDILASVDISDHANYHAADSSSNIHTSTMDSDIAPTTTAVASAIASVVEISSNNSSSMGIAGMGYESDSRIDSNHPPVTVATLTSFSSSAGSIHINSSSTITASNVTNRTDDNNHLHHNNSNIMSSNHHSDMNSSNMNHSDNNMLMSNSYGDNVVVR
jgi:hypothetical protein